MLFLGLLVILCVGGGYYYLDATNHLDELKGHWEKWTHATPKEEGATVSKSTLAMIEQMGGESRDPQARERLAGVGKRLVQGSLARETRFQFDFHLLADRRSVNAFALPGGQIFITEGLYRLLGSEDQLAGVLAHEIGHVVGSHSAADKPLTGSAQEVANLREMKYSSDDELGADRLGVLYLAAAGYQPQAMFEVMGILTLAAAGDRPPEFLNSHPLPGSRIQELRKVIAEYRFGRRVGN
ncbi:MAG: M48 family metalloprotease [Prosthecobacter sp.]|nr:M48 family metalloprotease [Prosthecobacter sp.]